MDDDPLSGLGLQPVTMADRVRFDEFLNSLAAPLSDYTFSQVFTWGNSLRILWKEIRGHLCVFANGTGDLTLLMPPIGQGGSDRALAEAFDVMNAYNSAHDVYDRSRVEYASEELLGRLDRSRLVLEPMGADYVYDVNRMIDLAGGDLASKRQLKNRFLRNYECRAEIYQRDLHMGQCTQLLRLWKQQQDAHHNAERLTSAIKRQKESIACEMALDHAHTLGFKGLVVYVRPRDAQGQPIGDWSIRGFTFGERLGTDQSSIVIEKTDLGVKGLAQFIFSEFCQRCWSDLPLVNAGDDWGLQTLAWTKMSYRPMQLLQKYAFRLAPRIAVAVPAAPAQPEPAVSVPATEEPLYITATADGQMLLFPEPVVSNTMPEKSDSDVVTVPLVRPARKQDMAAAVELEQTCFSMHCLSKRRLQYLQMRPSAVFLVAEHGGHVVGQGISLVRQHKKVLSGRIYSLAVKGEHRGKKIGHHLLRAMIDDLTARGVKRIYLEVEEANATAIKLYERHGFGRIGVLPDYYGKGKAGLHMMCPIPADKSSALTGQPGAVAKG